MISAENKMLNMHQGWLCLLITEESDIKSVFKMPNFYDQVKCFLKNYKMKMYSKSLEYISTFNFTLYIAITLSNHEKGIYARQLCFKNTNFLGERFR